MAVTYDQMASSGFDLSYSEMEPLVHPTSPDGSITLIGVGRLGLGLAFEFARVGLNVMGMDINKDYIKALQEKTFRCPEPGYDEALEKCTRITFTDDLKTAIDYSNVLYILVPTPNSEDAEDPEFYDHKYLNELLDNLNAMKVENKHVIIGCTVIPGYTQNSGVPRLADCPNVTVSYNPEFVAQGDVVGGFRNGDLTLIGEGDKAIGDFLEAVYTRVSPSASTCRMTPASAEITKLGVNCFVTTKIAYANWIGDVADNTENADKFDICNAMGAVSYIGKKRLMPGYGFGGPCYPRDNRALARYAESALGFEARILNATDASNRAHAETQAANLVKEDRDSYMFCDVAYKPGIKVPWIENSQKLKVAEIVAITIRPAGKRVTIVDRSFIIELVEKTFGDVFDYLSDDDCLNKDWGALNWI